MEEREAIERLRRGDVGGLALLVGTYQVRAARAAYLVTRDLALAEDIVQTAFLKVYERIDQFDARRPFGPWFLTCVLNDAKKAAIRRGRLIPLADDDPDDSGPAAVSLTDRQPGPEALWEQAETAEELWAALKLLTPKERVAVVSRYYLGLSEAEMALALDCTTGTVKWRLHAARERLRRLLRPMTNDLERTDERTPQDPSDESDRRAGGLRYARPVAGDQARVGVKTGRRPADAASGAGRIWTRRPLIGLATAALLALVVGVTSPLWNHPDAASAQAILDRAQATASGAPLAVTTYHLILQDHVVGKGNVTITNENWYGGANRRRSNTQVKDAQGAIISSGGVIFDGNQTWIQHVDNGQPPVVIHTVGTTWTNPVDDPSGQTSLADVLTRYGSDKQCMDAHQQSEATVANRPTYVIVVTPKASGCVPAPSSDRQVAMATVAKPTPNATAVAAKASAANLAAQPSENGGVGQMTVWVDEQTFLPLRTEVRDATGALLDQSEVTDLQYNLAIPDATFTYTPPAGVNVYNFTGGDGARVKEVIFTGKATPQAK